MSNQTARYTFPLRHRDLRERGRETPLFFGRVAPMFAPSASRSPSWGPEASPGTDRGGGAVLNHVQFLLEPYRNALGASQAETTLLRKTRPTGAATADPGKARHQGSDRCSTSTNRFREHGCRVSSGDSRPGPQVAAWLICRPSPPGAPRATRRRRLSGCR